MVELEPVKQNLSNEVNAGRVRRSAAGVEDGRKTAAGEMQNCTQRQREKKRDRTKPKEQNTTHAVF